MKVAVLTQYFPTSQQPWAGHSAYQTLRLLAQRCELHVFFPEAAYPRRFTPATHLHPTLDRTWQPPDVAVTYIPYPVFPLISRPLNGFTIAHQLLPHVRAFSPDLILNYVVYPDGYAAVRIAGALKVPVVLTAIGSDLNRISDPLCGALTRSALRHANYVTTVSHDLRNTAIKLGADPARTQAMLNGCDTAVFYPQDRHHARQALGLDPSAEIIVYVGRLDVRKGLLELIEATVLLRSMGSESEAPDSAGADSEGPDAKGPDLIRPQSTHPTVCCYLVGEGPDRSALVEQIARHNAGDFITLIPSCPSAQVALWMGASDLVTLPSYREGCPNVVIEALAAGRPVVATNVGGIPELMDDASGRLIPIQDVPALALALNEVLTETWDAADLSAKHSRSWGNVADDLMLVLQQVVREREG